MIERALATMLLSSVALGATACGESGPDAGAWEFKVDTVQAGGKSSHNSWLRLVGKEGREGESPARSVLLSFDCRPDQASSTIMTEQSLRQGSTEARLTVDAKRPINLRAFAGTTPTGGQVVMTIRQDSLLALLSGGRRAVIHYADGAGSSKTTAEFPLAGLEVYRSQFESACAARR